MESRKNIAKENFMNGHNCAQAVLMAYKDLLGLDEDSILKLALPFGGGIGRQKEVCGAISGMCMAAGMICGSTDPKAKAEHYKLIQNLCNKFKEENGSIVCNELLTKTEKKKPCFLLVEDAASILEDHIKNAKQSTTDI